MKIIKFTRRKFVKIMSFDVTRQAPLVVFPPPPKTVQSSLAGKVLFIEEL